MTSLETTRFARGAYAEVIGPKGSSMLLIWPDKDNDDHAWIMCPVRPGYSYVLVWQRGRWNAKGF